MNNIKIYKGESLSLVFSAYDQEKNPIDISEYEKEVSLFTPFSKKLVKTVANISTNSFSTKVTPDETSGFEQEGGLNLIVKLKKGDEVKIAKSIPFVLLDPDSTGCGTADRLSVDSGQVNVDMEFDNSVIRFELFVGSANNIINGEDSKYFTKSGGSTLTTQEIDERKADISAIRMPMPVNFSIPQQYINADTGVLASWGNAKTTPLMPIGPEYVIQGINLSSVNANCALIAFYQADGTYIKDGSILASNSQVIDDTGLITPPVNAAFFRMMYNSSNTTPQLFIIPSKYLEDKITALDSRVTDIGNELPNKVNESEFISANKAEIQISLSIASRRINSMDGELSSDGWWSTSDFIPVNSNFKYNATDLRGNVNFPNTAWIAFYDSDKGFINEDFVRVGSNATLDDTGIIVPPANATYMRVCNMTYQAPKTAKFFCINNQYLQEQISVLGTQTDDLFRLVRDKIGEEAFVKANRTETFFVWSIYSQKIDSETGELSNWGSARLSEPIPVKYLYNVTNIGNVNANCALIAFYQADGTYIKDGSILATSYQMIADTGLIIPPNGAAYFRLMYDRLRQSEPPKLYALSSQAIVDATGANRQIRIIGDSIANQIGSKLRSITPIDGHRVIDTAVGGESCLDTLARLGAVPYVIKPFTIAADTSEVTVEISSLQSYKYEFDSNTGEITSEGGDTRILPFGTMDCEIEGIKGRFTFTRNTSTLVSAVTFRRDVAGDVVEITQPTIVIPTDSDRNVILIDFMGTNTGWKIDTSNAPSTLATLKDADNLVNQYRKIADWMRPTSNDFVFLGFYVTGIVGNLGWQKAKEWFEYFESEMRKEFGLNYIPVREYLMTYGWKDAGVTLTADDVTDINQGKVPRSVLADGVHLTNPASVALTNKVLDRLHELGIISKVDRIPLA